MIQQSPYHFVQYSLFKNMILLFTITFLCAISAWSQTDIARGKPATASSSEGNYTPDKAVDGNGTTRWSSNYSDPQWIKIDLGTTYSINQVVLVWELASASDYSIEVSSAENGPWTPIVSKSRMPYGARTDNLTGLTGSGRYIRMNGKYRTTPYGYSLYSFEVYSGGNTNYTLNTSVNPVGAGTITLNPSGGSYTPGRVVSLTAVAASGYRFTSWSLTSLGSSNPAQITMNGNYTVTANFVLISPNFQAGDLSYYDGSAWVRIPKGNYAQVLTENAQQVPVWNDQQVVTDIEGNLYTTVKIGAQTWMKQDLKTTHFNDGTPIPNITVDAEWAACTSPAYCWIDNNIDNSVTQGAIYNWYAINTGKLAPKGWHVPTDADWNTLSTYLGGDDVAGGKLREAGFLHWPSPNIGATDEVGFTALPAGYRNCIGPFDGQSGSFKRYWTATELTATEAYYRYLYIQYTRFGKMNMPKNSGYAVRLIKDN
jgi:uncharacterized protein (TIGR02145 family)